MRKVISYIIGIPVVIFLLGALVYGGMCTYSNFIKPKLSAPPPITKASWELRVTNTGTIILTDAVENVGGVEPGQRIFLLQSYWEHDGTGYKYCRNAIQLDEKVFGEIKVRRRSGQ